MLHRSIAPSVFRQAPLAVRALPVALIAIGALAVLMSLTAMGFELLSFLSLQSRHKKLDPPAVVSTVALTDETTQSLESLERRLEEVERRALEVGKAQQEALARVQSVTVQEPELNQSIEQRRSALREAESAARHYREAQRQAAEEMQRLRAEAADLERHITALRASIEETRRAAAAQQSAQHLKPQLVECVRGAVILKPQGIRIASSALAGSQFVTLARQQGVYFLVQPSGFDSFIVARNIARAAGVVVGYEPNESAAEK